MCCIACELPLCSKSIVKSLQHLVKRTTELLEFLYNILINLHISQIIQLYLLHLRCEASQRLKSMFSNKIGKYTTQCCYCSRNIPIGYVEFLELKKDWAEEKGEAFSQKEFHEAVLEVGPAPFEIVEDYMWKMDAD